MTRRVPELSLKAFSQGADAERAAFSTELMRGLKDYGFIVLRDHDVPIDLLDRAYAATAEVFALPEEAKRRYSASNTPRIPGSLISRSSGRSAMRPRPARPSTSPSPTTSGPRRSRPSAPKSPPCLIG